MPRAEAPKYTAIKITCNLCHAKVSNVLYDLASYTIMKCPRCGLVFISSISQFTESELYAKYDEQGYWLENPNTANYHVGYKEDYRVRMWRRCLKKLERYKTSKGRKLLDVGCATGVFLDIARKGGWDASGVEISRYASGYVRDKFKLKCFTGTLEEAAFPGEMFDVITLWDVIEHLVSPRQTVAEAKRILKLGGIILVFTPDRSSLIHLTCHILYKLNQKRVSPLIKRLYASTEKAGHLYFFSRETLTHLLTNNKLKVVYVRSEAVRVERGVLSGKMERIGATMIDLLAKALNRRYRMMVIARKPYQNEFQSGVPRG